MGAPLRMARSSRVAALAIVFCLGMTVPACSSSSGTSTPTDVSTGTTSTATSPPTETAPTETASPSHPAPSLTVNPPTAPIDTGPGQTQPTSTASDTTGPSASGPTSAPGPLTSVTVSGTIATGLKTPWGLGFLPDGTALVTERDTAKLLSISPDSSHSVRTVGIVDGVEPGGEGGLLGLAVSAHYASDHTVFVYYTAQSDNRVAALTLAPDAQSITHARTIVTGIPKGTFHNGGRLLAGPDGTLFIGTGDAQQSDRAQDLSSLGGKILHVTADGSPVAGHPFDKAPLVYSYGHRNVQGLAFDDTGHLWASEFGANRYDELNRITPGGNYGWPIVEGPSDDSRFIAPYKYWPTSEASPSGLAIDGTTAFLAALRGTRLWLIPLDGPAGSTTPIPTLEGTYGRLRTVVVAPDGSLWLTTSNTDGRGTVHPGDDRILRLAAS